MKKCPLCDLNYIEDDEEACEICRPKASTYKLRRSSRSIGIPKPKEEGNIAFKCNYCDGGKSDIQIGYAGVCSRDNIKENIEVKKRTWCTDSECKCQKYLNGQIEYEQLKNDGFLCYESRVLIDWKASAGEDRKEGERRGRNRKLSKDVSGGLCVLTAITPEMTEEKERIIFGVFISDKFEEGEDGVVSGFVQCTSDYKIKLTPSESKKIKFWNYYFNQNESATASWASGLFRYIDNYQSAQILYDIAQIKKDTADEDLANRLFAKYCKLKNLNPTQIPDNNGALTRTE